MKFTYRCPTRVTHPIRHACCRHPYLQHPLPHTSLSALLRRVHVPHRCRVTHTKAAVVVRLVLNHPLAPRHQHVLQCAARRVMRPTVYYASAKTENINHAATRLRHALFCAKHLMRCAAILNVRWSAHRCGARKRSVVMSVMVVSMAAVLVACSMVNYPPPAMAWQVIVITIISRCMQWRRICSRRSWVMQRGCVIISRVTATAAMASGCVMAGSGKLLRNRWVSKKSIFNVI